MEIGSADWCRLLVDGAAEMGLDLAQPKAERLARHAAALLLWSRKKNITTIIDPLGMAVKHYLDSLSAAPDVPEQGILLDIGSGGGFPGIPLAVLKPDLRGVLLEAVRQKASFLAHAIGLLGLTGWQARQARAEELACEPGSREAFDVVVCRALTRLDRFFHLARPLLRPGGIILALKGPEGGTELAALQPELAQSGACSSVRLLRLPITAEERVIITIRIQPPPQPGGHSVSHAAGLADQ